MKLSSWVETWKRSEKGGCLCFSGNTGLRFILQINGQNNNSGNIKRFWTKIELDSTFEMLEIVQYQSLSHLKSNLINNCVFTALT